MAWASEVLPLLAAPTDRPDDGAMPWMSPRARTDPDPLLREVKGAQRLSDARFSNLKSRNRARWSAALCAAIRAPTKSPAASRSRRSRKDAAAAVNSVSRCCCGESAAVSRAGCAAEVGGAITIVVAVSAKVRKMELTKREFIVL